MGVQDLNKIKGQISLKIARGDESFFAISSNEKENPEKSASANDEYDQPKGETGGDSAAEAENPLKELTRCGLKKEAVLLAGFT